MKRDNIDFISLHVGLIPGLLNIVVFWEARLLNVMLDEANMLISHVTENLPDQSHNELGS